MKLIEITQTIREVCDALVQPKVSRYTLHLESQIADLKTENLRLEGKCDLLQLKLENALAPKPIPIPVRREIQKVVPPISSWELYLRSEIERQELEDRETQLEGNSSRPQ